MDLDDLLEDLWEDWAEGARDRVGRVKQEFDKRRRLPAFRRRMRTAALYGSAAWAGTLLSMGIGFELATPEVWGTVAAIVCGGVALPAVGTGVVAWRARRRDLAHEREAAAKRRAKQERSELPPDVTQVWVRLRRAEALVADLATQGLVEAAAVAETGAMVEQLHVLLVADRRAAELGAESSAPLRDQVHEVADLLVALAAEAVEHRTEVVGESGAPATLRDARDRLVSLRAARAEVAVADRRAAAANDFIEAERARRGTGTTTSPPPTRPAPAPRPERGDDERGTPMPG